MTGIWKLTHQSLIFPPSKIDSGVDKKNQEIVLRLNGDGTFGGYESSLSLSENHDLHHILGRGGCWEYQNGNLILAADRPKDADASKVHDTILTGKLLVQVSDCLQTGQSIEGGENYDTVDAENNSDIDVHLSIAKGQVCIGKFTYPKKHNAFFDEPMLFQESSIGFFSMVQVLGNLNARLKSEREKEKNKPVAKYHKKDFWGRRFYLTATSHKVNEAYAAKDIHYDEEKVMHDIRVIPISFHANNTFSAAGTEKILRGRYGMAGEKRDRIWFQVSLFGAGRSAPGSVYSEGRLLSHDDRRGYLGLIQDYKQNNQTKFFVEGEYYYGTDLKRAIKPNSMGTFTLQEILQGTSTDDVVEEVEENSDSEEDFDRNDAFQ